MKKTIFLLFFFFGAQMYTIAQSTAPDFTVTDAHGNEHKLYQDYLDQGITVIIDLFFTSCPPCNAKAPVIQQLYVDWGEGNNDLQIIELSVSSGDTDAKVLAYEAQHGLTFPGVSPEGGSMAASQVYRNSPSYFGTPGFVIINPDKTLEWVYNNSNLIPNLEAAISATGAVKPSLLTNVAGKALTIGGRPIPGAKIYLEGFPLNFDITDSDGNYSLDLEIQQGQQYHLVGEKNDSILSKGISTIDLIKLTKHLLNVQLLSDHEKLAADLNNDGKASTLDMVSLRKIILKTVVNLPGRANNWDFKSSNLNSPGFSLFSNLQRVNLVGFKFGDLDDSIGL